MIFMPKYLENRERERERVYLCRIDFSAEKLAKTKFINQL